MKRIQQILLTLGVAVGVMVAPVGGVILVSSDASASTASQARQGVNRVGGSGNSLTSMIRNVINAMLFLIGAISVIMIIVGGIRYTTSGGDSSSVKAGKDTVLYAVIGLVVAIAAYAIVNFVISVF